MQQSIVDVGVMKVTVIHQHTESFAVKVRPRADGLCEVLLPNMLEPIVVRSEADIEISLVMPMMMQVKIVTEVQ